MKNEKLLSIIVPVYNVEKYLEDCLNSILNQNLSLEKFEVICIDDGSPDSCGEIIDKYSKKYDNVIAVHQENKGVSCARNKGLEIATGKYIWFVDSDDLIANNSISLILNVIQKKNYPDVLYVGVKSIKENEQIECCDCILSIEHETPEYRDWMFTEIIKSRIIKDNHLKFDEKVFLGEDDIFCVFVNQYVVTTERLNKVVYFYRQRKGSALHSNITGKNFERYIKTFSSDLWYAEKYDFFWYKKDGVVKFFPNIMYFIASQNFSKGNYYIKILKNYNLFPMRKYKNDFKQYLKIENISRAKKIRIRASESYFKYLLLRIYVRYKN